MKKLLCIVLAAALVLSLGVGALAYEDMDPPLWQRWGYNSLAEYLEDWDETEEEYAAEVAEILAERAEQDAFIATYLLIESVPFIISKFIFIISGEINSFISRICIDLIIGISL